MTEDIFEKAFGKAPLRGYEFKYLDFQLGWQAIVLSWGCSGVGFGELAFIFDRNQGLTIDDECMGKEFVLVSIEEVIKRINEGQKASVFTHWDETQGPQYKESEEGVEKFIESSLLMFKYYLLNKPGIINDERFKHSSVDDDSTDSE